MSTVTRLQCDGCKRVVDGKWSDIPGWVHLEACTLFMSCADTIADPTSRSPRYSPRRLENVSDFCSLGCLADALKAAPRQ